MSELLACSVDGVPGRMVPVDDRGFQYGDGVFTTIAIKAGKPLLWERHAARLTRDAEQLNFIPPSVDTLHQEALAMCHGIERATLKIVLTRSAAGRGYRPAAAGSRRVLSLWQRPPPGDLAHAGVALRLCRVRLSRNPALAGAKHLNRLEQVLARGEWGDDYAEGLMQDTSGAVIEGTMTNIFIVRDGVLFTPELLDCGVNGVMRALVLERARANGIRHRVAPMPLDAVQCANEVFLTNSLIGIWPVRRFETKEYGFGPITRALQAAIVGDHDSA